MDGDIGRSNNITVHNSSTAGERWRQWLDTELDGGVCPMLHFKA